MSKRAEFTPGPWKYNANTRGIGVVDTSDTQSYGMMLVVAYIDECDHSEYAANARLIAAAPCLLDVCQRLLEAVPYVSEYDVPLGLWDDLRAAIAKATGVEHERD